MPQQYDNTNTGALFKVPEEQREDENYPHYTGSINVEGKEKRLAAWIQEASGKGKMPKGTKFLSIKASDFLDKSQAKGKAKVRNDDPPF
jgi:hypothetical protein